MSDNNTVTEYGKFSLLYPKDGFSALCNSGVELLPDTRHDLGLDNIVAAFSPKREYKKEIAAELSRLIQSPEIIQYRQDIIEDLLNNPPLVKRLADLLPVIDAFDRNSFRIDQEMNSIHKLIWRIGDLQNIVDCVQGLSNIFEDLRDRISSAGLRGLVQEIQKINQNPLFQNLVQALPDILSKTRACASITIGVNLDASLRPFQATLLSVNDKSFTGQSMLNKLFGFRKDVEGIAPLHSVPQRYVDGQVALPIPADLGMAVSPMMVPLFADLDRILEKSAAPIVGKLKQYSELQSSLFINLRCDLIFYLGAVQFIQRLHESGLPICRPEILPSSDRICDVLDSFNANLVLRETNLGDRQNIPETIVKNDIHIGPEGRILILTGPNQGGKTTYLQGVGLVQILAQVGCYVPGKQARISPVDQIFTHFPLEEKPDLEMGRLGEEATRLERIFQKLTSNGLVLLNESLASTSSVESLYLAQDIVKILRKIGARAIYSTHLHELANRIGEMNAAVTGDSKIVSLVSSPLSADLNASEVDLHRTYKIEVRPPLGQSFAHEIAMHYGISFEQLQRKLEDRGMI